MFKSYKEAVPQNSRTIIFEKFGDYSMSGEQLNDLYTLLATAESTGEFIEIADRLTVKSFEEFKRIFEPVVYEITMADESGRPCFSYSLDKDSGGRPVSICTHAFYKAVHDVSVAKSTSDKPLAGINYDALQAAFDPEKQLREAHQKRKVLDNYALKMNEAKERNNPTEHNKYLRSYTTEFFGVIEEYRGNAIRLIPLKIADAQRVLQIKTESEKKNNEGPVAIVGQQPLALCTVEWDENGDIVAKPASVPSEKVSGTKRLAVKDTSQRLMLQMLNQQPEGSINQSLIMSVYSESENSALMALTTDELVNEINKYSEIYSDAQKSFCDTVVQLVQKISNIEMFFSHAANDNGRVESGVLIANCDVEIFKNNEMKARLKKFLEVLKEIQDYKIWFAILPSVTDSDKSFVEDVKSDSVFQDFDSLNFDTAEETSDNVYASDINLMVSLLAECDILSFVNFRTCEATGFKNFGVDRAILDIYKKELSCIERKSGLVLAHPNFTILPKGQLNVKIGETSLYIPGVYVDAAYVAAGIVVATQTRDIQNKLFPKDLILADVPFVHVNLEDKEINSKFPTKINPESQLNMSKELKDIICGKEGNMFCFISDTLAKHANVLTARSFDGRPIYQNLVARFLKFYLSRALPNVDRDAGIAFASKLMKDRANENGKHINSLYVDGEEFAFNEETNRFTMKFISVEEPIELDIDIID